MHPSPAALIEMTDAQLTEYREQLRTTMLDHPEHDEINSPYRARVDLINAILDDRKRSIASVDVDAILDHVGPAAATIHGWSDRYPATIVSQTETTIVVQRDRTQQMTRDEYHAQLHAHARGHGDVVVFIRDTDAPLETFTKRRNGRYVRKSEPMRSGTTLSLGTRAVYRDPSF